MSVKPMPIEQRIRCAESELFGALRTEVEESFLDLDRTRLRVRVLAHGSGTPLVLLHGVSLSAAAWAPLFPMLPGRRLLALDLPGHGLSDPVAYARGRVRVQARDLVDDVLDALELDRAAVVGHSLGGMFALWHAAAGAGRISAIVAMGAPAVAVPGAHVRMPLSLLTVPGVGLAILRAPSPRRTYRRLLAGGLGAAELAAAPDALVEALRLSARRPANARTVASLMHAIDRFRRPRSESVLTSAELAAIDIPTTFVWGTDDPYQTPSSARPWLERIPAATLYEVSAGHAPWLVDPRGSAGFV